jgi:hypothetical protein
MELTIRHEPPSWLHDITSAVEMKRLPPHIDLEVIAIDEDEYERLVIFEHAVSGPFQTDRTPVVERLQ